MDKAGPIRLHYPYSYAANATRWYIKGWPEPYISRYIQCTHGILSREITIHTVIYGADIRFWPTLYMIHDQWWHIIERRHLWGALARSSSNCMLISFHLLLLFSFFHVALHWSSYFTLTCLTRTSTSLRLSWGVPSCPSVHASTIQGNT